MYVIVFCHWLSAHTFKPQDRKDIVADKVPGYKKGDKKGLLDATTSMLSQYQQGSRGLFGWWGKPEYPEKHTTSLHGTGKTV